MQTSGYMAYVKTLRTVVAASALAAAGLAQAQLAPFVTPQLTLAFSEDLMGALAVGGIQTSPIAPAVGKVSDNSIVIAAPLVDISGDLARPVIYFDSFTSAGGVAMVAPTANFATSGGSLSVTNVHVDLASQGIYAKVSGANGLSGRSVRVWDFANSQITSWDVPGGPSIPVEYQFTGLTITSEAFDLFKQGLGLRPGGVAAMASIPDYGVMTVAIPEPSTYALLGLGLLGVAGVVRRNRLAA